MKLVNPNDPTAKRDISLVLDLELDEEDWKEMHRSAFEWRDNDVEYIRKYMIEKVNVLLSKGGYTEIMDFDCRKQPEPDVKGPLVVHYPNGECRTVKDGQVYVLGWNKITPN